MHWSSCGCWRDQSYLLGTLIAPTASPGRQGAGFLLPHPNFAPSESPCPLLG